LNLRKIFTTQNLVVNFLEIMVQFADGAGSCGYLPAELDYHYRSLVVSSMLLVCILGFSIGPPMVSWLFHATNYNRISWCRHCTVNLITLDLYNFKAKSIINPSRRNFKLPIYSVRLPKILAIWNRYTV